MCECTIWRSLNAGNTFHVTYLEVTCREMLSCRVQQEEFSLPRLSPAGCFINAKCRVGNLPSFWWCRAQRHLDTTITGVQGESWGLKGLSLACCLHLDRSVITKTLCSFSFLVGPLLNPRCLLPSLLQALYHLFFMYSVILFVLFSTAYSSHSCFISYTAPLK